MCYTNYLVNKARIRWATPPLRGLGSIVYGASPAPANLGGGQFLATVQWKDDWHIMEIKVSGRKINVGEALTTHIEDRLNVIAEKYFNRSIDAAVIMSKESHLYHADCKFHVSQGVTMQGRGEADDPYGAFEDAAEKVEKQLRRYRRRIKNHHNSPGRDVAQELIKYTTLAPHDEEVKGEAASLDDHQPMIIAEAHKEIPILSVGDATMLMDIAEETVFMFRNAKNNSLEVVYKRPDGNFGWISPE